MMKILNFINFSIFQSISIIFVFAYIFGIINLHFSDKSDYCVMTYMFEYPQFVRISLSENKIYPQYGLYAYSEGRLTEKARKMWFDGVPVLFLPGNSGSHMQARSLASVALRKALSKGNDYHFDFFTVSFNEELSGVFGGVLESQTTFAAACVTKVLSLYKSNKYTKSVPTNVILIGHSMGGLIAKRLLAYPSTLNSTSIAITLAAPLEAPLINFDVAMNNYYMLMDMEWEYNINEEVKTKKMLLSFGNGPRDMLMQSGLTSSNNSFISALSTAIPGVWVSPDHVSIVWCKQLVMAINRFLFSIIEPRTGQIVDDQRKWMHMSRFYFEANRSVVLDPSKSRPESTMLADAFWYEDNRRIYQIARPDIDRMTYLMIRLVSFPQNRFVAIEAVNLDDKEWIFGCNAKFVHNTYRYCKQATSLNELSRWTGTAAGFGKRKLATIDMHSLKELYPDWTHVVVKVSPSREPITLNVDGNDLVSRQITAQLSDFTLGKTVIIQETEPNSIYYEILLPNFNAVHQAFLLYVEPSAGCKATQYHISAELHVPWAKNHEYFHYYTHAKRSPMKLRLYKSNPNITKGLDPSEPVKVTLLLDPQCTYTISISSSIYQRLAQIARNYSPVIVPYMAGIVLLAARSIILHFNNKGMCISMHDALMSEGVKPYYALVFSRLGSTVLLSVPILSFVFENASWRNLELQHFMRSLLVLPAYMTALGILNIVVLAILVVMVFSSQLAHRLLFRIVWRGPTGLAEKVASGLQKVPLLVSAALVCAAPLSCGAASLATGAAFYGFMLSKMYEEYLEDYVYKLMAKIASKICRIFKSKNKNDISESTVALVQNTTTSDTKLDSNVKAIENTKSDDIDVKAVGDKKAEIIDKESNKLAIKDNLDEQTNDTQALVVKKDDTSEAKECKDAEVKVDKSSDDVDEELNNLHFHMMMFLMWLVVTAVNIPALLTWARNFKYSMALTPDTSYHTGLVMSACSSCIWQLEGPRRHLRHYDSVAALLFTMAIFIISLGPLSWTIINYGVTFMFATITVQQLFDRVEGGNEEVSDVVENGNENSPTEQTMTNEETRDSDDANKDSDSSNKNSEQNSSEEANSEACECNENRIYGVFKKLREKFTFDETL